MKSVRLTKEMRLKILSRLLGHTFSKREAEIDLLQSRPYFDDPDVMIMSGGPEDE